MKSKKGLILTLFCTLMSLSSCNNNCVEEVCPSDGDVVVVTPREYEDSNKQDPLYNGEDVYVSSIKINQYGSTYIDYNGSPLNYRGVQLRTDAFMNTDKRSEDDIEILFKTSKEAGFDLVEVPLEWADVEIAKDVFDYFYVFKVLEYANKYDLKVEFLWFGTNMCGDTHSYTVPDYILKDGKTYPKFDAPRTGEFWSYYGLMWYLDFSNSALLEREGNALTKILDFIYEYDSTHGGKKSVVGIQVHNEADIFARWRIFSSGKEVVDPSTKTQFKKEDAFKHVLDALDYLGKVIKSHKYKIITRCNIATGTKGDADGEYSGIYKGNGEIATIRSFIKDMQALEGIDIVGDDSYNATIKDNKGIMKMYRDQLPNNYAHIAENDGNYANTPSLLLTSVVMQSGYLVYELATSPFFKKNNASDIDQGIYSVNNDKTLSPKKHAESITETLNLIKLASTPASLTKDGNVLGFNLVFDSPISSTSQDINSENIKVKFSTEDGAIGYAIDYDGALYAAFTKKCKLSLSNAEIYKVETGNFVSDTFTSSSEMTYSDNFSVEANILYKFSYKNVAETLVSNAFENLGK